MVSVLFVMNIDLAQFSTPFASVTDEGCFGQEENEVLFSMHTVFRIELITPMSDNSRLVLVHLNLVSDRDNDLRQFIEYIRQKTFSDASRSIRLGTVLWKMSKSAKAREVFEMLLRQKTEENVKAPIYHQIGLMKQEQGEYAQAIRYYERSIEMKEKQTPHYALSLAASYSNIGLVYDSMGDYSNFESTFVF